MLYGVQIYIHPTDKFSYDRIDHIEICVVDMHLELCAEIHLWIKFRKVKD